MTHLATILTLGVLLGTAPGASADTLRFKNGATIEGTYLGGDTRHIQFMGRDGTATSYSISDVAAVEFAAPAPATAPRPAPAASPSSTAPATATDVTIPAGTEISVRMIDNIDARATAVGERFRASIDDPVVVDDRVVIPRGADATVQIMRVETGGRLAGSDELAIKLYDITVGGKRYEAATDYAQVKTAGEGTKTAQRTAVLGAVGAAIGAIAGGGKGAAIGAASGAGAGVATSAARGPHLKIPSETRLVFELRAPLPLD